MGLLGADEWISCFSCLLYAIRGDVPDCLGSRSNRLHAIVIFEFGFPSTMDAVSASQTYLSDHNEM